MLQDTVLVGGFAFLVSGAVIWFLLNKVNESSWPEGRKRLSTYALIGVLIAVAIFVIDWHSSNYKEEHAFWQSVPHQSLTTGQPLLISDIG